METDLIFNKGVDLPEFAAFPLLETKAGRALLGSYYMQLLDLGDARDCGVFLESTTWLANRDRAAKLGYKADDLAAINQQAIRFMADLRGDRNAILSAQIGPRFDGYALGPAMSVETAEAYHYHQIAALAGSGCDIISAFTMTTAFEAAGIARAATKQNLPVCIAFTVETDGRLPDGMSLSEAIETVDHLTGAAPVYYLVNCAHPDHLTNTFGDGVWMRRVLGVVANASRSSHACLDQATKIDAGNPQELGAQLAALKQKYPHFKIFGGCCGTDFRHLREIITALGSLGRAI